MGGSSPRPTSIGAEGSKPGTDDSLGANSTKERAAVVRSIIYYGIWSSVMLVSNKIAITAFPMPASFFCIQIAMTILFIQTFRATGLIQVDNITLPRATTWLPYACSFCTSIYCSGKALQHSNVETVIVFRSCSPLVVSLLDYVFLGRAWPSVRSTASLVGVLTCAGMYVLSDSQFQMEGLGAYGWVSVYLCAVTFEMTFGKFLIAQVQFANPVWGATLYTNVLALPLLVIMALVSGEVQRLEALQLNWRGVVGLLVSIVGGCAISWAGWNCREKTSATTYTLLGVICKFLSVLLNVVVWDKHATPPGLFSLVLCLVCGYFYEQAPVRGDADAPQSKDSGPDEELQPFKVPAQTLGTHADSPDGSPTSRNMRHQR